MKSNLSLILFLFISTALHGQSNIKGTVIHAGDQLPIIGATVLEKGTTNGTITDVEGQFSLEVGDSSILIFQYVGLEQVERTVTELLSNNRILMQAKSELLEDVVITAFGIERSKKAAGFSAGEIDGELLSKNKQANIGAQLVGQVAGLDVTRPSNGATGSSRIIIRGLSQFQGENRPLIVLDGMPIDNSNVNTGGLYGGQDSGDGLSSLNPDDLENITVLKGPAAASLYGSRAGNGVILITTKSGKKSNGIRLEFNSNYSVEEVAIYPKFQQEYGQGANGQKPSTQQEAFDNWRSWGAKLDGEMTPIFNGEELPYSGVAQDEMRNFYQTGHTFQNNVAVSGNAKIGNARFSIGYLENESIIPTAVYDRLNLSLDLKSAQFKLGRFGAKVKMIRENATNRVNLTDNPSNPSKYFTIGPANLPQDVFKATRDSDGNPIYWSNNPFTLSPYWGPNENGNMDIENRWIYNLSHELKLWKNVSITSRFALDNSIQDYENYDNLGTQYNMPGSLYLNDYNITEINTDITARAFHEWGEQVRLDVSAGAVSTDRKFESAFQLATGLSAPFAFNLEDTETQFPVDRRRSHSRVNAWFVSAQLALWNNLYLESALRTDYFSVLTNPDPNVEAKNSVLYGSGSLSYVLSDALQLPSWVSFLKLRGGVGSSGYGQIDPYSQVKVYRLALVPKEVNGQDYFFGQISGNQFVNPSLVPSRTLSYEAGFDVSLWNSRVGLDFTYYSQQTDRHIFPSPLPASTGYASYLINAGIVRNSGIEALLKLKMINKDRLKWDLSFNFTTNDNRVVQLSEGVDQLNLGVDRTFSANIVAQKGGRIGDIWGNVYARNGNGDIIHGEDGIPLIAEEREILGNFNPNWYGALRSSLSYKDFNLSFLIDTKQGGEILSTTSSFGFIYGTGLRTLEGRENEDFTIVGKGVGPDGQSINTTPARLEDYYTRLGSITEENVYDASYVKLRQMSLSYNLPKKWTNRTKYVQQASISLVANNVFFFSNGLDVLGLDPESIYTATASDVGIEYAALPSTRTYGVNLSIKIGEE